MKVLVLGGGGGMGRVAAREAARFPFVERVTAADLSLDLAQASAVSAGARGSALQLDVNDRASMAAAIGAHDVVLNAVGPFYLLGVPVLEQVIAAGRNYIDICDDWEPTLDMLEMSAAARDRGVTAIVGLGASPGVSNFLAMRAVQELDEVSELLTGWSIEPGGDDGTAVESGRPVAQGASAAMVHWMQQLSGEIRVLRDGSFQNVKPLERLEITYPGHGALSVWSVGHPEAVTLPRVVGGLHACANVMVGPEEDFAGLKVLAGLVDSGALNVHEAADEIAKSFRKDDGARTVESPSRSGPALFAWARGRHAGRPAVAACQVLSMPPGGMAGATSVPLALGLPFLHEGFNGRTGVFTPDELIDPTAFFNALAPQCRGSFADAAALLDVQRAYVDG